MSAEEQLALAFLASHPPRAALALEQMGVEQASEVLGAVPPRTAATVVHELTSVYAAGCIALLAPEQSAAILGEMRNDDATAVLRSLPGELRETVLAALPQDVREPFRHALRYPDGTAGAEMDPTIFHLPDDVIVADARTRLRSAARDLLYYIYVVDRDHRLVGVLDMPELMLARTRDPVSVAMHREVDRLPAWMPTTLVREHPGWHRYHAMPVVDEEQRLVGAIRYQTLRRLEREGKSRGPEPGMVTARALAELFQLGTSGLVSGVAATAGAGAAMNAPPDERDVSSGLSGTREQSGGGITPGTPDA